MPTVFTIAAALPLFAGSAFGWGCEGHQVVALIARAHLTARASAAVDELLRENPIDPALNRFCKDRPPDLMADSSTWADDVKNTEKTGDWHFINIPVLVESGDALKWCGAPGDRQPACIVTAIESQLDTLRNKAVSAPLRAKALRYLIHLMGDLTQPLHDSDNRDEGGNCTSLQFFAEPTPVRLHAIWDYKMIARELEERKMTEPQYAAMLDRAFAQYWPIWGQPKGDPALWAWEGRDLSSTVVYGNLNPPIPVEAPATGVTSREACDAERDSVAALHISVGQDYMQQALPVIHQQLAKAGYRLAAQLNTIFK